MKCTSATLCGILHPAQLWLPSSLAPIPALIALQPSFYSRCDTVAPRSIDLNPLRSLPAYEDGSVADYRFSVPVRFDRLKAQASPPQEGIKLNSLRSFFSSSSPELLCAFNLPHDYRQGPVPASRARSADLLLDRHLFVCCVRVHWVVLCLG